MPIALVKLEATCNPIIIWFFLASPYTWFVHVILWDVWILKLWINIRLRASIDSKVRVLFSSSSKHQRDIPQILFNGQSPPTICVPQRPPTNHVVVPLPTPSQNNLALKESTFSKQDTLDPMWPDTLSWVMPGLGRSTRRVSEIYFIKFSHFQSSTRKKIPQKP